MTARQRGWRVPTALVALSVIPVFAGTARQFAPGLRRRRPGWHRAAGRVLVVAALGVVAIRRGDVATHRAWMMRAYAIALAAGTQAFTEGVGGLGRGAHRRRAATVLVGDRP